MHNNIMIVLKDQNKRTDRIIEVSQDMKANDFIMAIVKTFGFHLKEEKPSHYFLVSENPIVLLKGSKTLKEFGLRNGSEIIIK